MKLSYLLESSADPALGDKFGLYHSGVGRKASFAGNYEIVRIEAEEGIGGRMVPGKIYYNGEAKQAVFVILRYLPRNRKDIEDNLSLWAFEVTNGIGDREYVDTSVAYRLHLFDTRRMIASKAEEVKKALEFAIAAGSYVYSPYDVRWE